MATPILHATSCPLPLTNMGNNSSELMGQEKLEMLKGHHRTCDVCDDPIPRNVPYKVGVLDAESASWLLDVADVRLVPTWTQIGDRIELDICLGCAGLMPITENFKIRVNS